MPPGGVLDARTTQSSPVPGFAIASKTTASAAVVRTLKHGHSVNFVRRQWHGMATQSSRGRLRPASENHRVVQRGRKFALEASN